MVKSISEESDLFRIGGKRDLSEYEKTKKEFEKVILAPSITITIELPKEFREAEKELLELEKDKIFLRAVSKLAIKHLKKKA